MDDPLEISHELKSALNRNEPVVALESCVITHGLPRPTNVQVAFDMEKAVKQSGATPATIGIINGKLRVGLTTEEIELLGSKEATKVSVRDMPFAIARGLRGGTTVSATVRIATAAGINVIVTGGIGGISRGYPQDVSADLWELAHTPAVVVCSGIKAIADVQATVEWLETHGVPIYGYETDELPAFYSRSSGIPIPKIEGVDDLVELLKIAFGKLGVRSAVLIAVPVPKEHEFEASETIDQAVAEAKEKRINGKELTPFLLNRVDEFSKGKSREANMALLVNNARTAGRIAVAIYEESWRRMGFRV
ncbi:MAG: pseudouridine-5'-phosphate glycosidase [Armatimonadetes bacterium]|nr:pseudouridine-5'-phosphate glycosidase [Armatimonadota bacterium]